MSGPADIQAEIVRRRESRRAVEGPCFGKAVPLTRQVPLVPFLRGAGVICEIKRRSPSRGALSSDLKAAEQAGRYAEAGVLTVSVLTEEDYFQGSLNDLMEVKNAFPELAVLRKDFLTSEEDIEVSWRAGADAVLLIASMLDPQLLEVLYLKARSLGLAVLLEVHSPEDVEKASKIKPRYTGINCRDLVSFRIDRTHPLTIRPLIRWRTRVIFESGILSPEDGAWVQAAGFDGLLVGEGAVKNPALAAALSSGFQPRPPLNFWAHLYSRSQAGRPFVKICGLTRLEDLRLADELGADLLGFILTESPRRVSAAWVRGLPGTRALKVGVVRLGPGETLDPELEELWREGSLDAFQFHGDETPAFIKSQAYRGYKALGLAPESDGPALLDPWKDQVRVLVDSRVAGQSGGTGQSLGNDLLSQIKDRPLWLAGGLSPDRIGAVVRGVRPELVDASSGLESAPGIKDPAKVAAFFKEIKHASAAS